MERFTSTVVVLYRDAGWCRHLHSHLRTEAIMRRLILVTLIMLVTIVPAAEAYTITGGTPTQRAYVRAVVEASQLDIDAIDEHYAPDGFKITLAEAWDPFWYKHLNATWGVAYSFGHIVMDSDLTEEYYLGETTGHELAHLDWYTLGIEAWVAWRILVGPGDPSIWLMSPAESYAEHARLYAWAPKWYTSENIRSDLPTLTYGEWWSWRDQQDEVPVPTTTTTAPPVTTTTTVQGNPFPDVNHSDEELWQAAWFARNEGLIMGFSDGRLGAFEPLLRRHVALVAGRAGVDVFDWVTDYGPATRGEVRDTFKFEWKEERWDEPLLRSQLLRLLWRARE